MMVRTGVEWVDNYHDPCAAPTLSYQGKHALDFQNNMTAHGCQASYAWGDDNAWETDFRANAFGGDSFDWSENVEFCYFAGHGGMSNNIKTIHFTVQHAYCDGWSDQWMLGYFLNLKWLVLDSCDAVLGTDAASVSVWFGPMRGIHQVFGFVSDTHESSWWTRNLGGDFGNEAGSGQVLASSWVDQAYSFWANNESIAIAAGATQQQAIWLRDNETIWNQGYPVASTNWLAWKWRG